jgi:hypothetical protein
MKCPKSGYHSFDHLDSCKKCNTDLSGHKDKFNLSGFYAPGQTTAPQPAINDGADDETPEDDGAVDFGFDFLDEEDSPAEQADSVDLDDNQEVSIDQPFGADSETIPAETPESEDDDNKSEKGPEFAF